MSYSVLLRLVVLCTTQVVHHTKTLASRRSTAARRRHHRGAGQALRRPVGPARPRPRRRPPAPCSACSATTAPARPPPSASSPRCRRPPRAGRRWPVSTSSPMPAPSAGASASPPSRRPSTGCSAPSPTSRWSGACTTCRAWRPGAGPTSCWQLVDLADDADRLVKTFSGGMRRRLDLAASLVSASRRAVPRRAHHRARPPQPRRPVGPAARPRARAARPSCSPPSTWRRPTGWPTTWSCSTTAGPSPRARPIELKARIGEDRVEITVPAATELPRAPGASSRRSPRGAPSADDERLVATVPVREGVRLIDVMRALDDAGIDAVDLNRRQATLDDVFLTLTGHDRQEVGGMTLTAAEPERPSPRRPHPIARPTIAGRRREPAARPRRRRPRVRRAPHPAHPPDPREAARRHRCSR